MMGEMQSSTLRRSFRDTAAVAVLFAAGCSVVFAQKRDGDALLDALRSGGYVIVMRHASSPRAEPDAASAAPGNVDLERQLDEQGRDSAIAMGNAVRHSGVPIGEVLSSPTFRAMQTAELLNLGGAEPVSELGDGGRGMQRDSEGVRSTWLREDVAQPPPPGTNRLMITHTPNLVGAFGDAASGMADGESLIIMPANGEGHIVGRMTIEQWPQYGSP